MFRNVAKTKGDIPRNVFNTKNDMLYTVDKTRTIYEINYTLELKHLTIIRSLAFECTSVSTN